MRTRRAALLTCLALVAIATMPGCNLSGGGGATVDPARIEQSQQLHRRDASSERIRSRTITITTPGSPRSTTGSPQAGAPSSDGAPAPVLLLPGPPSDSPKRPDSGAETPRGGGTATRWERLTRAGATLATWTPAVFTTLVGSAAIDAAPELRAASSEPMVRVRVGDNTIDAPPGTQIVIDEYEQDTLEGGEATANAEVDARSAGWRGVGAEVVGTIKAGLAKFVLPGLPGSSGATRGGSGGGGSHSAGLSSVGGGATEGIGATLIVLGAIAMALAVPIWWFGRPVGTKVAIAVALVGATLITLGIFVGWEWAPLVALLVLLGAGVAGVLWLRKRKLEDQEYDQMADDLEGEAIDLRTTLEAVVQGVENTPENLASVVKDKIKAAAIESGRPADVKRVVSRVKAGAASVGS